MVHTNKTRDADANSSYILYSTNDVGALFMKLHRLVLKDVMRRRNQVLFAVIGVLVGTMTVVGIFTISRAGEARMYEQLELFEF